MVVLTRDQLEERLAALHRASLELMRSHSLEDVLRRIVQLAREQARARYAALGVVEDDNNLVEFLPEGMTPEEIHLIGPLPVGKGLLGALKTERRTIRVADIQEDPRRVGFPPNHPDMRTFLGVPILLGDELLGLIYLTDKEDHFEFTKEEERVIETLAAYAAVAISNARLIKGLAERDKSLTARNEDLKLINDIAEAMTSTVSLDEILEKTLVRVMERLEVEAGEIFLSDEGGKVYRLAKHRGESQEAFYTHDTFRLGEGYIGTVAQTGTPLICTNLPQDGRFLRKAVLNEGFVSMACIPLGSQGKIPGVMCVATRKQRQFDDRSIALLTAIGAWAGLSIENARLNKQAQRLAVLEERERIGMDLHDGIIQSIYGVGLALDYAHIAIEEDPKMARSKIDQAIEGLNNTIRDIRSYILDLRPRQFRGEDLMSGLQQLIEEFRINSRVNSSLVGPQNGLVELPTAHATALFHICQEALANAAKHARAKQVNVHLWTTSERVLMEVVDNGKGFDLKKKNVTLGHGLSNMQVRARKVGGEVEISSDPGEGTTVLAWVPRHG
jgi:two-component system, NarL family, sensor histidine kinase DevS